MNEEQPVEEAKPEVTYNVKLAHVVQPTNTGTAKWILIMLAFFAMLYIVFNGSVIIAYAGAIVGLFIFMLFGAVIGGGFMYVWADKPTRVKYLNMLLKGKNYHIIELFRSGKRTSTFIAELGKGESLEIGKKRFIIDSTEVRMHNGAPTLCYDERTCSPINFDTGSIDYKKSPELFSIAIQKERELARLQVTNWAKALKMILWVIVGLAALSVLVNVLNYFKLDDVAKAAGSLAQQAIDTAGKVVPK